MLKDSCCNACDRRDGDGVANCYRIEAVINVIDVMAMMMEMMNISIGWKRLMHVIDVIATVMEVMDIVIGLKL